MEGTPFGRYRLIELLGRGGMGEVWRAYDTAANNRTVAIKLLPPQLAADHTFVQRFRREADAAAGLNNPHIIPIHNYGEIDGRLYVDMRLIEGRDLQEVLAEGSMEPGRAVRIIEQVAKALHAAHKIGLIHRDVKPSNILLDEDDFAYLIDFGLARAAGETRLTSAGFIGSWHYMAPERFGAQEADARADVYALACVLYECLTGHTPYPGNSLEQQYDGHRATPPPRPSSADPSLSADFDRVTEKGMAKDPDERYATTVALADAARDAITTPLVPPSEPTLLDPTRPAPAPARRDDQVRRPMQPPAPVPVWQQPADLHPAATPQRPPGWPPVPQPRPGAWPPPQIGTPPPWGQRPRRRLEDSARSPWWRRRTAIITTAVSVTLVVATVIAVTIIGREPNHSATARGPTDTPNSASAQQYPNLLKECAVLTTDILAKTVGADPRDIQSTYVGALCRWQAANPAGLIDITRFWFERGSLDNERKVAQELKYQVESRSIAGVDSIVMRPNDPNGSCGVASDAAGVVGWWINPQAPGIDACAQAIKLMELTLATNPR